jgi:hypothetical protein
VVSEVLEYFNFHEFQASQLGLTKSLNPAARAGLIYCMMSRASRTFTCLLGLRMLGIFQSTSKTR